MKKILSFLLTFILLLQIFLFFPDKASALLTCPVTTSPSPVTTNDKLVDLTINTSGILPDGNTYWVRLGGKIIQTIGKGGINFTTSNGTISVQRVNAEGYINPINRDKTFDAKSYTVIVQEPSGSGDATQFCSSSFTPEYRASGRTCEIKFLNDPTKDPDAFTVRRDQNIRVDSLFGNPTDQRRVIVKREKVNGADVPGKNNCYAISSLQSGVNIGPFEAGAYYIEVRDSCNFLSVGEKTACFTPFAIGEQGGFGPSPGPRGTPEPICKGGFCETALGKIFTDPANFVRTFFGILLSLAGGIAIILIIISGYRLMSSGGNSEKVQAAREQLTSAIVGLLFIIFSLSILQIIGVDILHIPGFFAK